MIGGYEWKIKFKPRLKCEGIKVYGWCCEKTKTIAIEELISDEMKFETLAHEMLHAWAFSYDFDLGHRTIEKLEGPFGEFLMKPCFIY